MYEPTFGLPTPWTLFCYFIRLIWGMNHAWFPLSFRLNDDITASSGSWVEKALIAGASGEEERGEEEEEGKNEEGEVEKRERV